MDKRQQGIIATAASALTCGCCGLFLCVFGALSAAGVMPYTMTLNGEESSGTVSPAVGIAILCVSLILIAIPIAVGFFTLRNKPEETGNEPLPPAA